MSNANPEILISKTTACVGLKEPSLPQGDCTAADLNGANCAFNMHASTSYAAVVQSNGVSERSSLENLSPILEVIPPSRKLFLSGLSPAMNVDHVRKYMNQKSKQCKNINVKQMKLRDGSDHSSFIVFVGRDTSLFKTLLNPLFWPKNLIVHEFVENFQNPRMLSVRKRFVQQS